MQKKQAALHLRSHRSRESRRGSTEQNPVGPCSPDHLFFLVGGRYAWTIAYIGHDLALAGRTVQGQTRSDARAAPFPSSVSAARFLGSVQKTRGSGQRSERGRNRELNDAALVSGARRGHAKIRAAGCGQATRRKPRSSM